MKRLIIALAVALVALEAADGFLTMWAVNHGYQETNPWMAPLAHTWWGAVVVKVLPAAAVSVLMVKLGRRFPKSVAFGLSCASAFLVVVLVGNLLEL